MKINLSALRRLRLQQLAIRLSQPPVSVRASRLQFLRVEAMARILVAAIAIYGASMAKAGPLDPPKPEKLAAHLVALYSGNTLAGDAALKGKPVEFVMRVGNVVSDPPAIEHRTTNNNANAEGVRAVLAPNMIQAAAALQKGADIKVTGLCVGVVSGYIQVEGATFVPHKLRR